MRKNILLLLVLSSLVYEASAASWWPFDDEVDEVDKKDPIYPLFNRIDTNDDASISFDEFKVWADGKKVEIQKQRVAQQRAKLLRRFANFDKDGSGYLDKKEFKETPLMKVATKAPSFEEVDRDNDGKVSAKEFFSIKVSRQPQQ